MESILRMDRRELLALKAEDVTWLLTDYELVYITKMLGAFWRYNYNAASKGRVGKHALLKSGLHSDGFFVSRILLEPENIRNIILRQIVARLDDANIFTIDYVVGVPYGATELGYNIAEIIGARKADMEKVDNRIVLTTEIPNGMTLLLVEDFCTRGTGFKEAVLEVKSKNPSIKILPYNLVILNRGGLKKVVVEGVGRFSILPVVEQRVKDWDPKDNCPLCDNGSVAIEPKVDEESWRLLTTSQLK